MSLKKAWLVALTVTSLFFSFVVPAFAYYQSPIDFSEDSYVRFGNADYPQFEDYDLRLDIDHSSVSHSWVNMTMTMWGPLVTQRHISHFLIIANGKVIEEFRPQYVEDPDTGELRFANTYYLKPSVTNLIGAPIWFQVVAVERDGETQYAVAWTGKSEEILMDDLPVKDKEAIAVLYAILEKLKEMVPLLQNMLSKLQEISEQIKTMFTPTPAAAARLENAANNLLEKTPIDDMIKQSEQVKDMFEKTPTNAPMSELQFGEKRDWFHIGMSHYLIDLTQWKKEAEMIRKLLDAIIWMEFFLFLLRYLQPKLQI